MSSDLRKGRITVEPVLTVLRINAYSFIWFIFNLQRKKYMLLCTWQNNMNTYVWDYVAVWRNLLEVIALATWTQKPIMHSMPCCCGWLPQVNGLTPPPAGCHWTCFLEPTNKCTHSLQKAVSLHHISLAACDINNRKIYLHIFICLFVCYSCNGNSPVPASCYLAAL